MPRSLLEAAHMLSGDKFAPEDLAPSVKMLQNAISHTDLASLEQEIKTKYLC
jgi:hypothetical protein